MYYEVDCFWFLKNPYVPIDVPEPTLAMENQKDLVGEGRQERQEAVTKYEASQKEDELTEEETGPWQASSVTRERGISCESFLAMISRSSC